MPKLLAANVHIANSFTSILHRYGKNIGEHNKVHVWGLICSLVRECRKGYKTPNRKRKVPCHCLFGFDSHTDEIFSPKFKTPVVMQLCYQRETLWPNPTANTERKIPIPKFAPALFPCHHPWVPKVLSVQQGSWAGTWAGESSPSTAHFMCMSCRRPSWD